MNAPVVVHVGLSKTGTTTLQKRVFHRLPGTVCLTPWGPAGSRVYRELGANLRLADDPAYLEDTMRSLLAERTGDGSRALLWSDENLAGVPWKGADDPARTAARIARLVPEAKVVVCVRHQGRRLGSLYSLYLKKGGVGTFRRYVEQASPSHTLDLDRLAYDVIVRQYRELFGADRVKVMAYEMLVAEPTSFLGELTAFVGSSLPGDESALPVDNRSLSAPSRVAQRRVNRWFRRSQYNPRPLVADVPAARRFRRTLEHWDRTFLAWAPTQLGRADQEFIDDLVLRFAESNARLLELSGLPLAALGYPLPPTKRDER